MPDWVRLRQAAWGLGLVLNGNKVISNSAAVGVSSGLRRWHPSSLPVDFVVVVLLEGTGSHDSRAGVINAGLGAAPAGRVGVSGAREQWRVCLARQ